MSTKLKLYLGRKVIDSLHNSRILPQALLQSLIQVANGEKNKIELSVPLNILESHLGITNVNEILKIQPDDIIKRVELIQDRANRRIAFEIDRKIFVKDVLENATFPDLNFKPKTMVVEYSSPNIAKPFHLGHLRSTIIGNFISNLNMYLRNKVSRLNYLGDWGTQFGFIKVGVEQLKYTSEDIKNDPLNLLYKSYVYANKLAETDPQILEKARQEFAKLEEGSEKDLEHWHQFMKYTRTELENTYGRLGVTFDDYNYESMYGSKQIEKLISKLRQKNIVRKESDGTHVAQVNNRKVTVVKSDGTTLYLTRDIAAAIDRYERYKFDRMFYVVENGQNDHFNALKTILRNMDLPWADRLTHVKFGRIKGMSTRKGNVVFLKDILDECKEMTLKRQIMSPTTKADINDHQTTDILGISCVIINDLKQRRQKDYEFDWDKVLQIRGDTGVKLQYTHCRLCSLEKNSGAVAAKECDSDILREEIVTVLLKELAKFQDVLYQANEQLEACILVNYLFHLCTHINNALKLLPVKGSSPDVAAQRMLLFKTAKEVLRNGMMILGLKPLEEM